MISSLVATSLTALILYVLLKRFTRPSLSNVRGPKPSSFILGNLLELFQRPVGETDFEWQNIYGNVVRFRSVFWADELFITDPKALQTILNTSAYYYPKRHNLRAISRMLQGEGVLWADGDDHKRQRRVLLPGFGAPETRAFLSIFRECAESMSAKWTEIIGSSGEQKAVLNIPLWLSRGALDAMGQAAFDVQFGAVQSDEHQLVKQYNNLLLDIFGHPSAVQIFVRAAAQFVPSCILEWMTDHVSNPRLERARDVKKAATQVAKEMVQEKAESLLAGKGSKDVFSLLVKANMDSEAKNKLTEEELFAQMRTIMFAGHETTSNSLSWILLELARHPQVQSKLRTEIREMEATVRARGDTQFTMADFDAMPYTTAVIKEGLRYHPVVPHVSRIAAKDDTLYLSQPITAASGQVINEIVIPKGTRILVSIAAYNRNTELWGPDAHEFNPGRWLHGVASEKKSVSIGVYSNLLTFLGGSRACLGWRFAVVEIQAFLVELIGTFEFTMSDGSERVCRAQSLVMAPTIDGEVEHGSQLPLVVSVAPRVEED